MHTFSAFAVERTDKDSSMLLLKMLDGRGNILPVFVGEQQDHSCRPKLSRGFRQSFCCCTGDNESTALLQEMQRQPSVRFTAAVTFQTLQIDPVYCKAS